MKILILATICLVLRHGLASLTTESPNNRGTDVTGAPVTTRSAGVTTPPATAVPRTSTSSAAPTTTTLLADNPLIKNISSDVFRLVSNVMPDSLKNPETLVVLDQNRAKLFLMFDNVDWSFDCDLGGIYMRLLEDEFVKNRDDDVVTQERLKKGARCKRDCNFDRLLNANYTSETANFTRSILPSMNPTVSPLCRDTIGKSIAPKSGDPITAESVIQNAAGTPLGSVYRPDQLTNVSAGDALRIIQAFDGKMDPISSKTLAVKLGPETRFNDVISVAGLVRPEILKSASPSDLANNIQSFASTVDSSQALVISSAVAKKGTANDVFNLLKNAGTRFADKIPFARLEELKVNISALPDEAIPSTYRQKELSSALSGGKTLADLDPSKLKLVVTKVSRDEISKIPVDKKSDAVINMLTAYSGSANSLTSNQRSAFLGGYLESLANLTKQQKIDRFNSLTTAQVEALAEIIVSANSSVYEWLRDSSHFITVINKNSKLSSEKCCSFLHQSRALYSMEAIKKLVPTPANIRAIHLGYLGPCFASSIPVEYLTALADADFKSQINYFTSEAFQPNSTITPVLKTKLTSLYNAQSDKSLFINDIGSLITFMDTSSVPRASLRSLATSALTKIKSQKDLNTEDVRKCRLGSGSDSEAKTSIDAWKSHLVNSVFQTSSKKKRQVAATNSLTCATVNSLSSALDLIPVEYLQNMPIAELKSCAQTFGSSDIKLTSNQITTLANRVAITDLTDSDIPIYGKIMSGYTAANLANLQNLSIASIQALGKINSFSNEQLNKIIAKIGTIDTDKLSVMGNLVCGLSQANIDSITDGFFKENIKAMSLVNMANCPSIGMLYTKAIKSLGLSKAKRQVRQVATTTIDSSVLSEIGAVVAGMSSTEFQNLDSRSIQTISSSTWSIMPASLINSMTRTQISSLSNDQLTAILNNPNAGSYSSTITQLMTSAAQNIDVTRSDVAPENITKSSSANVKFNSLILFSMVLCVLISAF
ncbi:unnamed protein product [Brachionus calyciflorus]|uniref:Uncharacterized protein n=1 Tax=Brachionus calyciflorus TaxID=104777 RepID=A0A814D6E7_9BILA|nr:unnamed protein product [Brachionus calyciflorus]